MLSASQLSAAIRRKKKKMMEDKPELVGTSPTPDMNAQDVYNLEKDAYVEDLVGEPNKISADEAMLNAPDDDEIMAMNKKRMGRLRSYLDGMDISD